MEEKHDFMWAIEQMKQDKKVRQNSWHDESIYIYFDKNTQSVHYNHTPNESLTVYQNMLIASDWEIYEEPKETLWNKRIGYKTDNNAKYNEKDVKQALKGFVKKAELTLYQQDELEEIFGKELLE